MFTESKLSIHIWELQLRFWEMHPYFEIDSQKDDSKKKELLWFYDSY